jgi:hypothetical protein
MVQSQYQQKVPVTLSQKNLLYERAGGAAQGVDLSSNPTTTKEKKSYPSAILPFFLDLGPAHS